MGKKDKKDNRARYRFKHIIQQDTTLYEEDTESLVSDSFLPAPVKAKNTVQARYLDYLSDPKITILIATGPAGTGKTMLVSDAAIKAFLSGKIRRIVITRPTVSVDEQHGFLPGSLEKKMDPWLQPLYDVFLQTIPQSDLDYYIENRSIEVAPFAYMRGRTFRDCWVIGDEMQNSTISQMKMLVTRIGKNSKLIMTGDLEQYDRGFSQNGLEDLINRIKLSEGNGIQLAHLKHIRFTLRHVERHPAVKEILKLYQLGNITGKKP